MDQDANNFSINGGSPGGGDGMDDPHNLNSGGDPNFAQEME